MSSANSVEPELSGYCKEEEDAGCRKEDANQGATSSGLNLYKQVADSCCSGPACGHRSLCTEPAMGEPQSTHTVDTREDVAQRTRALQDVPASGDVKKWMDNFFLNQAYGAFSMNVLADIFVRFVFLICTSLALLRCWRAKEREARLTEQQLLRHLDGHLERHKRYLHSDSFGRILMRQTDRKSDTPAAQSSPSPAAPSAPAKEVQEQNSIPILPTADSRHALPTENLVTGANQKKEVDGKKGTDQKKGAERKKKGPHEDLPKRRNGFNYDCDVIPEGQRCLETGTSSNHGSSSASRCQAVPTQAALKDETGGQDEVVIDVPAICVFPTSAKIEIGNKLKQIVKDKVGVACDYDISSSRIIQARVRATDENLSALRDVAVEGMKLDKDFTLQIGGSFLYSCNGNPEEPVLLSLRDVEVPTILQADYSAGVLTIRGRYLEGAEIRAATFDGYMILNCIKQDQINNNSPPSEKSQMVEVWRSTDLLPPVNLDQIQICASKGVPVEGHDVVVRSEVSSIQNTTLRTVISNWVPTAMLIVFLTSQAWILLNLLFNLATDPLHRTWLSYLVFPMAIYIIRLLSPRLEDNIRDFVEQLKLVISNFHVLPDLLSSPTFFMRNGYCFQRGAKHFVECKFIPGGSNQIEGIHDKQTPKLDEIPSTDRDWKWPCYKEEFSQTKKKFVVRRFDPDSVEDSSSTASCPFTVTYFGKFSSKKDNHDLPLHYVPQNIVIKLYSKYLQAVIKELLPAKLKVFEKYGKIQASDLLVLYIHKVLEKPVNPDVEPNDESEGSCLDMFHLIRFLKKEYEEIIAQYDKMIEAAVTSWDMLWTLILPNADVIFYCDVSKEELCGKVISTSYNLKQEGRSEFIVKLQAFDVNGINLEEKTSEQVVLSFKDEVKISDIDVYPLQHKANSHQAEEFFLMRGRKFYDLVLKYERRFMQYQGLIYVPSSKPWSVSHKESVDGRVMLDKGGFFKMHPNMSTGFVRSSRGWVQGKKLNVKVVIDEFDPLLKYAPAVAYGYAFSARKWGRFRIEGISEIQFISTAFDTLVMGEDIKNTLLTLAEHHIKHSLSGKDVAANVDPLPNKGKGCIILLHGPPGTGKTLTVEALAEKLECPLWQLSVSTNFEGTEELETNLLRTFEIAASWRAILVLDEADVYLSSRKYSPLSSNVTHSNATTGIFLRVVEYYTGILFLTTNVIDHIEPAIYSRMSLFVKYQEFSLEDRKQLWINFLNRIGFEHPSQEFWDKVLPERFNGRVIRNIIQNAQILADSRGVLLSEEHLRKACQVMAVPFTAGDFVEPEDKPVVKSRFSTSTTISSGAPSALAFSELEGRE